ncbi:hypothetical protein P4133_15105 [Pseudomonas aeruginosa]|nr:hypothetical protein [Pseudomonas aeruginosa]MDF5920345.1 hypothetical protein [Pseudomonas aeruginosa]
MKRSKLALLPLGLALLLAACASDPLPIPQHSFGVYATASTPSAAFRTLADPQGKAMLVALKPSLTQADVLRAEVLYDQNGRPGVEVTFTEPAARRLAALTGEARGAHSRGTGGRAPAPGAAGARADPQRQGLSRRVGFGLRGQGTGRSVECAGKPAGALSARLAARLRASGP